MRLHLDHALIVGEGPAEIEAVDADPVAQDRAGDVAGHGREGTLGGDVGGEVAGTAVDGDRDDVDDGAAARLAHVRQAALDQEEGRAGIDGHDAVEELGRGVVDGAPVGSTGGVDEAVQGAEAGGGPVDGREAGLDIGKVGHDRLGGAALRRELGRHRRQPLRLSVDQRQARGTAGRHQARGGLAHALRCTGDDGNLACERPRLCHDVPPFSPVRRLGSGGRCRNAPAGLGGMSGLDRFGRGCDIRRMLEGDGAMKNEDFLKRITVNPAIFGGKPIVRGMRISVELIIAMLAAGETTETLLENYPDLEPDDIRACLAYAYAVIAGGRLDAVEIKAA